jgi:diguanylate cyclase (GGDEF)-like protein
MPNHCTLLYAESDAPSARDVQRRLETHHIDAVLAATDMAAITALSQHRVDLIVANFRLGSGSGLDVLRAARKSHPGTPALLLVEPADIGQAAQAVRQEQLDYLVKDDSALYLDQLPQLAARQVRRPPAEPGPGPASPETAPAWERSVTLALAENQEIGIAAFGPDLRLRLCNARFMALFDFPETLSAAGTELADMVRYRVARGDFGDRAGTDRLAQQMEQLTAQPAFRFEQDSPSGQAYEVRGARLADGSLLLCHTAIGGRVQAERLNWRDANFDSLTGLPGRALFMELLKHQVQRGSRCGYNGAALLLLDLDGFKQLNQEYGNDDCDLMLAEVARRLTNAVRESDVVARLGGDQFGILVVDVNTSENTEIVAGKVLSAVARSFTLRGGEFRLTASIGIGFHPAELHGAADLMHMVEDAVSKAKAAGKNRYMFA